MLGTAGPAKANLRSPQIQDAVFAENVVQSLANIVGENLMRSKILPHLVLAVLFGSSFISTSCSSSPASCPVCGTDKNATVGLIDVMAVPGHSASGAPGGPFNLFDISWVDPANRLFYVSDNIGVDVAAFNAANNIAVAAIGGDS